MKRNRKNEPPEVSVAGRPGIQKWWIRGTLAAVALVLFLGLTGCADILEPLHAGDIPFEEEVTTPPDIGAVDNVPTVPVDNSFDGTDYLPF